MSFGGGPTGFDGETAGIAEFLSGEGDAGDSGRLNGDARCGEP